MALRSKKAGKTRRRHNNSELRREIAVFVVLAVCILFAVSNFGFGGIAGEAVSSVAFGIFGAMAYILPFVIFGLTVFIISNKRNVHAYVKAAAAAIMFIVLTALVGLITDSYEPGIKIAEYYKLSMNHRNSGGLTGDLIVGLMRPYLGTAGTYVVILLLLVICTILITERSLLKPLGRGSKKAYEEAKKMSQKHRERQRMRRETAGHEPRPDARAARKAYDGVSFATDLSMTAGPKKSPEVMEIFLPDEETQEPMQEMPSEEPVPEQEGTVCRPLDPYPEQKEGGTYGETLREDADEGAKDPAEALPDLPISPADVRPLQEYQAPPLYLLKKGKKAEEGSDRHVKAIAKKLEETLQNFGVGVHVTNASRGPSVTRYELQPEQGVKVSRIVGLANDIKLNLAVTDIRIEAPIPGKAAVGIEVPNSENTPVMLRDLLESDEFKNSRSDITFAVGKDIAGKTVVADIAKMPHLLVAGATGSGKSVCINTVIMSIIFRSGPDRVRLIMIDPKVVELSVYNGIPHLLIPVVTDPKKAAGALNWAVCEMEKRYKLFAKYNVRDIRGFNEKAEDPAERGDMPERMAQVVIIVDELADLMMVAPGDVESAICRLAQLARAAGIHLILATQRPSVNVITGLIKANMPSRIAFSVSSGVDSRTIIDMNGAEKLLGKGDMLFYPMGYPKPVRIQGSFVSDKEIQSVVDYLIAHNGNASYSGEVEEHVASNMAASDAKDAEAASPEDDRDIYFADAGRLIIDKDKASIGMLQRMFKIGFNRAARIMDQLAWAGVVGAEEGTKPRKILMTLEEFEEMLGKK